MSNLDIDDSEKVKEDEKEIDTSNIKKVVEPPCYSKEKPIVDEEVKRQKESIDMIKSKTTSKANTLDQKKKERLVKLNVIIDEIKPCLTVEEDE